MVDGARLLLARHGRHDWLAPPINRLAGHLPGVHLNDAGRAEAQALARRLASHPPDRIVSSPVERTRETATIVAEALKLPVATDPRFTETGMGVWEGQAVPDIISRFPEQWRLWRTAPTQASVPGMERVEAMAERMLSGARDYLGLGGSTLLVSHQDPLLALVCRLLDLPLDAMRRMEISPGSLTVFEVASSRTVLVTLNSPPGA
jgi:probable phosphoglycerate mutase